MTSAKPSWIRWKQNPILPNVPGTWMDAQTANPDLLDMGDAYFLYFRGRQGGHDRIGLASIRKSRFDGHTWDIRENPVIDVGRPGDWDETHALDPATVRKDGEVFLYYSAVCPTCPRSVCLATSQDGIHFRKYSKNPVVIGGGPEVVIREGCFYLYFWKPGPGGRGFQIHLAVSDDGFRFDEPQTEPVLPTGPEGAWDGHTVETPRIFEEDGVYYMMYCGSDRNDDYPWHAGLAVSRDLVHWEKYPSNPVFSRGEEGAWDEGAIWFTTVEKIEGRYYLWYEGYGGGTARTEAYGTYLKGGKSQIGMAILEDARLISFP